MIKNTNYEVIVGGGLCGLTAGFLLAKNGRKCLLLESEEEIGGLARSFILDDIVFDIGPHVLYDKDQARGAIFLKKMLGDAKVIKRPFRYAIMSKGRPYKFPMMLDPLSYPTRYKLEIGAMLLKLTRSNAPEESVRYSIESRFGKSFYENVFAPMIQKKTGRLGEKINMEWFVRPERDVQHIKKPRPAKIGGDFLEPLKNFFTLKNYSYPLNGYGEYAKQIHKAYKEAGGETILNCGKISVDHKDFILKNITVSGRSFPVRNFLWTGSINELNDLLGSESPVEPYMKSYFVFLTYNGKRKGQKEFLYTYHNENENIFVRIYYPENIYGEHSPRKKEGICLEINHSSGIEKMTDQEIVNACIQDVEKLGFFKSDALRQSKIISFNDSMPVYGLDYEKMLEQLFANQKKYNNIYSIGRTGNYYFCMSPAAVEQGIEITEKILGRSQA